MWPRLKAVATFWPRYAAVAYLFAGAFCSRSRISAAFAPLAPLWPPPLGGGPAADPLAPAGLAVGFPAGGAEAPRAPRPAPPAIKSIGVRPLSSTSFVLAP